MVRRARSFVLTEGPRETLRTLHSLGRRGGVKGGTWAELRAQGGHTGLESADPWQPDS